LRAYVPADEPAVVELLNLAAADLRALPWLMFDTEDFREKPLGFVSNRICQALVEASGIVVACVGSQVAGVASCWCSPEDHVALLQFVAVQPEFRRRGIGSALLDWCAYQARGRGCRELLVERWVDSRNRSLCALLTANGFRQHLRGQMNVTMCARLQPQRLEEPDLPRGCSVTTFSPGDEPEWVRLKNAIFGSHTTEEWFAGNYTSREDFLPEGWFFAVHRGRKVGIANVLLHAHPTEGPVAGSLEWVGASREVRGKGIGRALVAACMRRLYEWGLDDALLLTQYFREPAVKLYRSLGFRVAREHRMYGKKLV